VSALLCFHFLALLSFLCPALFRLAFLCSVSSVLCPALSALCPALSVLCLPPAHFLVLLAFLCRLPPAHFLRPGFLLNHRRPYFLR
jgi:hypothetical protein